MSIIETMAREFDPSSWRVLDGYRDKLLMEFEGQSVSYDLGQFKHAKSMETVRAALRAIKPSDISDGMVETLSAVLMRSKARGDITDDDLRRAIAAAIAAGAEQ